MPLPKVNFGQPYTTVMFTGGPVPPGDDEVWKNKMKLKLVELFPNINRDTTIISVENGELTDEERSTTDHEAGAYKHTHIVLPFTKETKLSNAKRLQLQTLFEPDGTRKVNGSFHYVPKDKRTSNRTAYQCLHDYLVCPKKYKSVDPNVSIGGLPRPYKFEWDNSKPASFNWACMVSEQCKKILSDDKYYTKKRKCDIYGN